MKRHCGKLEIQDLTPRSLPHKPGVYIMRDQSDSILYIGKAVDLAKRVSQYFRSRQPGMKIQALAALIRRIDYVPCESERDALLLESRLIKRHKPFYNSLWKDDKSYPYVKLTLNEDFPRMLFTRRKEEDGALYFGPYPKSSSVRSLLRHLHIRKLFPLRMCRWNFSAKSPLEEKKIRSCLYYHTRQCPAPCAGKIARPEYRKIARRTALFLQGKFYRLLRELQAEMKSASESLDYETAARIRDNLHALEHMHEGVRLCEAAEDDVTAGIHESRSVTELQTALGLSRPPFHIEAFDVSHLFGKQAVGGMVCFQAGRPFPEHYRKFRIKTVQGVDDFQMMSEIVSRRMRRLSEEGSPFPDLILLDGGKGQLSTVHQALKKAGIDIPLVALAKKREDVFLPGRAEPVDIPREGRASHDSHAMHLLQRIRDEVHRFGVTYHRKLRKKKLFFAFFAFFSFSAFFSCLYPLHAQEKAAQLPRHPPRSGHPPLPPAHSLTLKNGLRVLVLERKTSPTIAFHTLFAVGSAYDIPGKTGLAHLFEHMLFKGTKTMNSRNYRKEKPLLDRVEEAGRKLVAEQSKGKAANPELLEKLKEEVMAAEKAAEKWLEKDEYEKTYQKNGAKGLNAMTSSDLTAYFVSLPSNKLELWAAIESDRFKNPVLREFYRERDVVMEEIRMYASEPEWKLWEDFIQHAFVAHPYHNKTLGWMDDVKRLTRTDTEEFFRMYYGPENAVIAIVGDVDHDRALKLVRKKFGNIPRGTTPLPALTEEPPQNGERRIKVSFDAEPRFMIGYHKGDIRHPDQPVFEMIREILSEGRTSRLYSALVEGKKISTEISCYTDWPGERFPGLVLIEGTPKSPHSVEEVETGIYKELEKLKKGPIPKREMEKVRNQLEARLVRRMESNEGMAAALAYYEGMAGDWRYPWNLLERLKEVTEDDIHRVASQTFTAKNRTVAILTREQEVK